MTTPRTSRASCPASADHSMHGNGLAGPLGLVLAVVALFVLLPAAALAADSPSPSPSASPIIYRVGLVSDVDNINPFSTYMTIPWECFRVG